MDMPRYYAEGERCVLRGIVNRQIWVAQSVIVVRDGPQETALLLIPGAQCAVPRDYAHWRNGQAYPPFERWKIGRDEPIVLDEEFVWKTNRVLMILEPAKFYSWFLFWEHESDEFGCYYANFQLPFRRSRCGFDTLDLDLDIVVDPQYRWYWKDVDEYRAGIRKSGISEAWASGVERSKAEVLDRIQRRAYPLDGTWLGWRPDPAWKPPKLPDGWREI
jgi:protein associated with RNAse G/E